MNNIVSLVLRGMGSFFFRLLLFKKYPSSWLLYICSSSTLWFLIERVYGLCVAFLFRFLLRLSLSSLVFFPPLSVSLSVFVCLFCHRRCVEFSLSEADCVKKWPALLRWGACACLSSVCFICALIVLHTLECFLPLLFRIEQQWHRRNIRADEDQSDERVQNQQAMHIRCSPEAQFNRSAFICVATCGLSPLWEEGWEKGA